MTELADKDVSAVLVAAKQSMQQGRFADARSRVATILAAVPDHDEGLYLSAVCARFDGLFEEARRDIDRLLALRPRYARGHQESAHLYRDVGDSTRAASAYRDAVRLNPSLVASWQALTEIVTDDPEFKATAEEQARRLAALPPELLAVRNLIAEGKLLKAEQLCKTFMQKHPAHVEGMRLLADLAVRFDVLDDAEFLLEKALEFEPENRFARFDYVNVLYRRQKFSESLAQAKQLIDAEPDNESYRAAFANQCVAVGNYDEAIKIYESLLEETPDSDLLQLLLGHARKTVGDVPEAIEAYRAAYRARRDFGDAYWSLANLKTYTFEAEEMSAMASHANDDTVDMIDRIHLHFALGKAFEDRRDYETSFAHYDLGNRLKRESLKYDAERMTRSLRLQEEVCTSAFFADRSGYGFDAIDPIFIVGLPRSGSTLLEQILASHSAVDGTFELPNIGALAHRLNGRRMLDDEPRYPGVLTELDAETLRGFGQQFIEDTRVHRGGAPLFIDKMPNNFRHIGLIRLILPNAKIIDARRHPLACCFSGFKQLFASGQEFTYGLEEIGRYYHDYVRLMDHWDRVLLGTVHRVIYEDVVEDLESAVRRLLDYCGLPFEDACVEFHQTSRSIRTPSSEQVRQPIYTSGLEQWRRFEPWLDPLKQELGDLTETYRRPEAD